jgi:hypothetical protein
VNLSQITENLWIGTTPYLHDYELLQLRGVRLVINMRFGRGPLPVFTDPPVNYLWLRTFDNPLIPIPIRALIRGVHAALEVINDGGIVYVHCMYGRHRSVAMGSAILIAQGFSPEAAMSLIKKQRKMADPEIFYIRKRIMLFAHHWSSFHP